MPQMDGNELVRRAKQLHPGLPAMIVSGTVNAFDRALHADVFLPKGASSPAEMIERIRVLVARKRGPKKADLLLQLDSVTRIYGTFAHADSQLTRLSPIGGAYGAKRGIYASTNPYFRCHCSFSRAHTASRSSREIAGSG